MMGLSSYTVKGILTVIGGFLIHLSLGTLYTFGNMNPYVSSYLRRYSSSHDVLQTQTVWIFTLSVFGQGSCMILGGFIERKIGCRLTVLLGGWIMSAGVLLTYITIKLNLIATVVTYGLMFGVGTGVAYGVAISTAMSWFPNYKGLIGGIVVGGFGGGALIFNQIQTHFINPENLKPNVTIHDELFFDNPALLSRVPTCFLLIGGIYSAMQLLGALLVTPAPSLKIYYSALSQFDKDERLPIVKEPDNQEYGMTESLEEELDLEVEETNFQPREMLKTRNFWVLWLTFLLNSQAIVFISTLYKTFGEQFIDDDSFLAVVGSISAVFNASCRVLWGRLHDRFPYKWLMFVLCLTLGVALGTFPLTADMGKWGYVVWVCVLFGTFSGNFALFPAATSATFGHKYMTINFGILFTANALAGIVGATLTTMLSTKIGLDGVFYLGGGEVLLALLITFFYRHQSTAEA